MKLFLVRSFFLWSLVLLWSSSSVASALDYRWRVSSPSGASETLYTHVSGQSACDVVKAYYSSSNWIETVTFQQSTNPDSGSCFAEGNGQQGTIGGVSRSLVEVEPECLDPNYIDVVSGECVPPEEICFTELESMADQCVYIGQDDPADEVPPGCVVDVETGAEICLSEEPGCYVADGKTVCPTPDMVCGTKNGVFSCVAPEQEGCGYFNGERVCFTPDGDKVEPNSPDHPDNGGNLDGDETNDPTDSRTPEEGGNPDNQPIDTTGQGDGATEGTAREQLKTLRDLRDQIKSQGKANEGNGSQIESAISSDIDSSGDAATGVLDGHITDIDSPGPMEGDDLSTIGGAVTGIFGAPAQCQDIVFGVDKLSYTISCADGEKIRDLLGFLLYVFTIIRLFNVATRPAAAGTS